MPEKQFDHAPAHDQRRIEQELIKSLGSGAKAIIQAAKALYSNDKVAGLRFLSRTATLISNGKLADAVSELAEKLKDNPDKLKRSLDHISNSENKELEADQILRSLDSQPRS